MTDNSGSNILINRLSITNQNELEDIEQELNKQFKFLEDNHCFQRKTKLEFASLITDFKTELNCIHPFRDGNGRTIRKLIEDISYKAGFQLLFKNISFPEYLQAMIESTNNNSALQKLIFHNLENIEN